MIVFLIIISLCQSLPFAGSIPSLNMGWIVSGIIEHGEKIYICGYFEEPEHTMFVSRVSSVGRIEYMKFYVMFYGDYATNFTQNFEYDEVTGDLVVLGKYDDWGSIYWFMMKFASEDGELRWAKEFGFDDWSRRATLLESDDLEKGMDLDTKGNIYYTMDSDYSQGTLIGISDSYGNFEGYYFYHENGIVGIDVGVNDDDVVMLLSSCGFLNSTFYDEMMIYPRRLSFEDEYEPPKICWSRFDETGEHQWLKYMPLDPSKNSEEFEYEEYPMNIFPMTDGKFVITGAARTMDDDIFDNILLLINEDGEVLWKSVFSHEMEGSTLIMLNPTTCSYLDNTTLVCSLSQLRNDSMPEEFYFMYVNSLTGELQQFKKYEYPGKLVMSRYSDDFGGIVFGGYLWNGTDYEEEEEEWLPARRSLDIGIFEGPDRKIFHLRTDANGEICGFEDYDFMLAKYEVESSPDYRDTSFVADPIEEYGDVYDIYEEVFDIGPLGLLGLGTPEYRCWSCITNHGNEDCADLEEEFQEEYNVEHNIAFTASFEGSLGAVWWISDLVETADGDIIMIGSTILLTHGPTVFVAKADYVGRFIWIKYLQEDGYFFAFEHSEGGTRLQLDSEGNILFTGLAFSLEVLEYYFEEEEYDRRAVIEEPEDLIDFMGFIENLPFVIKINPDGDQIWQRRMKYDMFVFNQNSPDTSFYGVVGSGLGFWGGNFIAIDQSDDSLYWAQTTLEEWQEDYDDYEYKRRGVMLSKLDSDGEVVFQKEIYGAGTLLGHHEREYLNETYDEYIRDISIAPQGGVVLVGDSFNFGNQTVLFWCHVDSTGEVQWGKTFDHENAQRRGFVLPSFPGFSGEGMSAKRLTRLNDGYLIQASLPAVDLLVDLDEEEIDLDSSSIPVYDHLLYVKIGFNGTVDWTRLIRSKKNETLKIGDCVEHNSEEIFCVFSSTKLTIVADIEEEEPECCQDCGYCEDCEYCEEEEPECCEDCGDCEGCVYCEIAHRRAYYEWPKEDENEFTVEVDIEERDSLLVLDKETGDVLSIDSVQPSVEGYFSQRIESLSKSTQFEGGILLGGRIHPTSTEEELDLLVNTIDEFLLMMSEGLGERRADVLDFDIYLILEILSYMPSSFLEGLKDVFNLLNVRGYLGRTSEEGLLSRLVDTSDDYYSEPLDWIITNLFDRTEQSRDFDYMNVTTFSSPMHTSLEYAGFPIMSIPTYHTISCQSYLDEHPEDAEEVCSAVGMCVDLDVCECDLGYEGQFCESAICEGMFEEGEEICGGYGTCISPDECLCETEDGHYGDTCEELLPGYYEDEEECFVTVRIDYVVSKDLLDENERLGMFDCCKVVADCETVFDDETESRCFYSFETDGDEYTTHLIIQIKKGDMEVSLFSDKEETTEFEIIPITSPDERVLIRYDTQYESSTDWVIPVTSGAAGLIFLSFCLCLCFFCFILCCFTICFVSFFLPMFGCYNTVVAKQQKKLEKFNELDDFDVILQEQKLRKSEKGDSYKKPKKDRKISTESLKNMFEIEFSDVSLMKILGSGGSGAVVYLAKWASKKIAFKVFRSQDLEDEAKMEEFEKEVSLMSSLSHPNVLAFYGCSLKEPRIGIVMEFCENGDLRGFILMKKMKEMEEKKDSFDMKTKLRLLEEIAAGMRFLHSKKVIHRDLKCENVLLDKTLTCKIMDFGLSKLINADDPTRMTQRVGTSYYIAPEVTSSFTYTDKCDVFSFGIMMFEVMGVTVTPYGEDIFYGGIEMKAAMDPNFRPNVNELKDAPEWFINLMKRCWSASPEERPTFKDISISLESRMNSIVETSVQEKEKKKKEEEEEETEGEEVEEKKEEEKEETIPLFDHKLAVMKLMRKVRKYKDKSSKTKNISLNHFEKMKKRMKALERQLITLKREKGKYLKSRIKELKALLEMKKVNIKFESFMRKVGIYKEFQKKVLKLEELSSGESEEEEGESEGVIEEEGEPEKVEPEIVEPEPEKVEEEEGEVE